MAIIAPSLLAADFMNLEREVTMFDKSKAQWLHLDVMDGKFVPNISYGTPVIESLKKHTNKVLDTHLMIVEPERYIDLFAELGSNVLTVHYEASTHLHRTLNEIRKKGMKSGVALNPHTSVDLLEDVWQDLDLVLIMSVNPGFGGQKFIENTYRKVSKVKEKILAAGSKTLIEIDGGVNLENAPRLIAAGADVLVAGSSVFRADNPTQVIEEMVGF